MVLINLKTIYQIDRYTIMKTLLSTLTIALIALSLPSCKSVEKAFPDRNAGEAADTFALKMMQAVNVEAWNNTGAISWTFAGKNQHLWDRARSLAQVISGDTKVLLDIGKQEGLVWEKGERIEGEKKDKAVKKAWRNWANDSYWLNPVAKLFDEGVKRELVDNEGKECLLVTYTSGGVTPGDSYLWIVNENYRPTAWKMWVEIIPVKGVETGWTNWKELSTGAWISATHEASVFTLEVTEVKAATTLTDLVDTDPFAPLFEN